MKLTKYQKDCIISVIIINTHIFMPKAGEIAEQIFKIIEGELKAK